MLILISVIICSTAAAAEPSLRQINVFTSGTDGYHTFRIPALATAPDGALLAFCEGRKNARSDTGDIDLVLKRSFDGGRVWQPMQLLWDDGDNVCGNPCPVVDRETGDIHLLLTHNLGRDSEPEIIDGTSEGSRTVWVMTSRDNGASWTKPREITRTAKRPGWTWYATGPGIGIQLESGRLLVPCDHIVAGAKVYGSHTIHSDDHGVTWELGGSVEPHSNECQAVELTGGRVLLNMRNYSGNNRRAVSVSTDGGGTWSPREYDEALVEPVCQASILRYSWPADGRSRILFSNPADTKRVNMTVRLSYDECDTWAVSKTLHPGNAAYSCLGIVPGGDICCLYERGEEHAYERITFAVFNLAWLTDGNDAPDVAE